MGVWARLAVFSVVLTAVAGCGDDDAEGTETAKETCQPNVLDMREEACECRYGYRQCTEDREWSDCMCPELNPCEGTKGWECPPCEKGGEKRFFKCTDGVAPTCECPDSGTPSASDDAGT